LSRVVEAIKGLHPHEMNKLMIPGCTYCTPQVASVGLTEQAAKDKKFDIRASAASRSSATARPSRSARTKAWSK
jgi:pyruvate/2-oxoglutarate dehydrogenase complex dihydrolipoamide dehydrogenase (E3) component